MIFGASVNAVTIFFACAMAMILLSVIYSLSLLVLSQRSPEWDQPAADLPIDPDMLVVFVIPALNEGRVIRASIDRLLQLDHPGPYRVLVIDDGSDDDTAQIVAAYTDPRVHLLRRTLPDCRNGKGEALNAAYRHLIGESGIVDRDPDQVVVAILDADGRLDPTALTHVLPRFADPTIGGVQIGVRINNRRRNWLARMQDFEFVVFADVFQRARRRFGSVGLGGNGQFMRLSALMSLGSAPWSRSLTEDLDLGVRLITAGWRNEYVHQVAVHQQGVVKGRRLLRQRTRWFQGHLQAWSLLPAVGRGTTGAQRRDLVFHLFAPLLVLLASLLTVSFLLGVTARVIGSALGQSDLIGWWMLGVYALSFLPTVPFAVIYWTHERRNRLNLLQALLLGHSYVIYATIWYAAGWRATGRALIGRAGWAKTAREIESKPSAVPAQPA